MKTGSCATQTQCFRHRCLDIKLQEEDSFLAQGLALAFTVRPPRVGAVCLTRKTLIQLTEPKTIRFPPSDLLHCHDKYILETQTTTYFSMHCSVIANQSMQF